MALTRARGDEQLLGRRRFLALGGAAAVTAAAAPREVFAVTPPAVGRELSLFNTHTGEKLSKVEYWYKGWYIPDAMAEISRLLRDHRTDKVHDMDPKLVDLMNALAVKVGAVRPFDVISGYRAPESNAALRAKSSGVAQNSYHMKGMAVDLRLPGQSLSGLRKAALKLQAGGVGYYPKSNFVHVDVGPVRAW